MINLVRTLTLTAVLMKAVVFPAAYPQTPVPQADSQSANHEGAQSPSSGGVSTGGVYAPVLDARHRPITAGGFTKDAPLVFEDVTGNAGLSNWHHTMGTPQKRFIIEANGSGVALLD